MKPKQDPSDSQARPDEDRPQERPGEPPSHEPAPVDLASESAAGEEDPGASLDLAITPSAAPASDAPPGPKR